MLIIPYVFEKLISLMLLYSLQKSVEAHVTDFVSISEDTDINIEK